MVINIIKFNNLNNVAINIFLFNLTYSIFSTFIGSFSIAKIKILSCYFSQTDVSLRLRGTRLDRVLAILLWINDGRRFGVWSLSLSQWMFLILTTCFAEITCIHHVVWKSVSMNEFNKRDLLDIAAGFIHCLISST